MTIGLRLAVDLYRENEREQALDHLLDFWRQTRNSAVADSIEALSAQLDPGPLLGRTRHKRRREWDEIVEDLTEADVPRVLAAIPSFAWLEATELLQEVGTWLADPRISSAMIKLVADPPSGFLGNVQRPFWHEVMKVLTISADPRQLGALTSLKDNNKDEYDDLELRYPHSHENSLSGFLAEELERVLDSTLLQSSDLKPEDQQALEQLENMLRPSEETVGLARISADLLRDVYSDPEDDGARLVVSDILQELSDPRGEFIALQMALARGETLPQQARRRMKDLFLSYGRQWLGEIEPFVMKSGLAYRRGFPAVAKLVASDDNIPNVLDYPQWSTFEELDVTSWHMGDPLKLLQQPQLQTLRRVLGALPSVFWHDSILPYETLGLRSIHSCTEFAHTEVLPKLRHLDLSDAVVGGEPSWSQPFCEKPDRLRALWDTGALGHQLSTITVSGLSAWLSEWLTQELPIETVVVKQRRSGGWGAVLSRDADGLQIVFSYKNSYSHESPFQELRKLLKNLSLTRVRKVCLELGPGVRSSKGQLTHYMRLFSEHGIAEIELPQPS